MRQTLRRELAARRPGPTRLEVLPIDVAPTILQCRAFSRAAAALLTEPTARAWAANTSGAPYLKRRSRIFIACSIAMLAAGRQGLHL